MSSSSRADASTTPSLRGTLGFLFLVAGLFIVGGLPLHIFLGEPGIILAQLGLLFVPAVLFVWWRGFDPVRTFSLRMPTLGQTAGGVLALVGGVQVAWFLAWLQGLFMEVPVELLEAMTAMFQADSLPRFLWLLLLAAAVPALAEEVLFRGVVLSGFRSRLPTVWAVIGAGLIFGLFHLSPQTAFRFLPTAWLGILLAWVVVSSGSLPLAILLHFLNNAAILTATALPFVRDRMAGPEDAPPLVLLPIGLLVLAWGLWILHVRRDAEGGAGAAAGGAAGGPGPSGSNPRGDPNVVGG